MRIFSFSSNELIDNDEIEDLNESKMYFITFSSKLIYLMLDQGFSNNFYVNYYQIEEFVHQESKKSIVTRDILNYQRHFIKKLPLPSEPFISCSLGKHSVVSELMNHINILSNFKHSNKIDIKHFFSCQNYLILVMEYLEENLSLEDYLKENLLISEKKCKLIMIQIIELLRFCHNRNIFHNNLSLKNIVFSESSCNKIKVMSKF